MTGETTDANICADSDHLPRVAPAGMGFTQLNNIVNLDIGRINHSYHDNNAISRAWASVRATRISKSGTLIRWSERD